MSIGRHCRRSIWFEGKDRLKRMDDPTSNRDVKSSQLQRHEAAFQVHGQQPKDPRSAAGFAGLR